MELTKDADKLICAMYKAYLESRKAGTDKFRALHFTYSDIATYKPCINWSRADIRHTEDELVRNGFGKCYMDGSFFANDQFIVYMENRFKNGLSELVDFLTKFI